MLLMLAGRGGHLCSGASVGDQVFQGHALTTIATYLFLGMHGWHRTTGLPMNVVMAMYEIWMCEKLLVLQSYASI